MVGPLQLSFLDLQRNELSTFDEHIFENNTELSILFLNKNHLTSLPSNIFEGQSYLWLIRLDQNNLTSLPKSVFNEYSLQDYPMNVWKTFNASHNCIESIIADDLPRNAEVIDLSYNRLTEFNADFGKYLSELSVASKVMLHENPWRCDDNATKMTQSHASKVNVKEMVCVKGDDNKKLNYTKPRDATVV